MEERKIREAKNMEHGKSGGMDKLSAGEVKVKERRSGKAEEWKSGGVEERRSGRAEEWKSGEVEERRSGRAEEWKSG